MKVTVQVVLHADDDTQTVVREVFTLTREAVRRGDKWRGFAELNGGVHATPERICAGH